MVKTIDWKKLTKKHKVYDMGSYYLTGSDQLITWSSREARAAQLKLKRISKKKRRK